MNPKQVCGWERAYWRGIERIKYARSKEQLYSILVEARGLRISVTNEYNACGKLKRQRDLWVLVGAVLGVVEINERALLRTLELETFGKRKR